MVIQMVRGRTKQLTDSILGQHLALSVAAGLARTQLVSDPLAVYDAQHLTEMVDIVARALAKVATLYVRDAKSDGEPRSLTPEEQETASIRRGATQLVLKDGRTFSNVTMKRGDLRQAIAVLKAVGVPELSGRRVHEEAPAEGQKSDLHAELLAALGDIDRLLARPALREQVEKANRVALSIARKAPQGRVANLAMQLMSCLHDACGADEIPEDCRLILARLRSALEEVKQA